MSGSQLVARHLKKYFKSRAVVNDLDIVVRSGECVGLLGPNGAGKTTSFYMIVGLEKPDMGHIFLDDADITKAPVDVRARLGLGYLPQEASVFRKLSVYNNIAAILELRTDLTPAMRDARCEALLQEFHVTHLRHHLGMSLSGGERRRVEIARALAIEPKFILLDEPFAGVDPISVLDIKKIIQHLCSKNIGVLMTDHNVRETLDICTRAYIVNQGQILAEGSAQDILSNEKVRQIYLGQDFVL